MAAAKRIVIIGAGFAGAYCAQALGKTLRGLDAEVVLIDRNNYFIFYPMLVEAGTGDLEPRHVVVPIREFLHAEAEFYMGDVTGIDFGRKTVEYCIPMDSAPQTLPYDHLVLALGSVTKLPPVPGLREHGFDIKTVPEAIALRDRMIRLLEIVNATTDPDRRRALLQIVVVGGNFTGVEVAGQFHMLLRHAARIYRNVEPRECNVLLVELTDRILPALDRELADYAVDHMTRRGIVFEMETTVERIEPDRAILKGGKEIPTHTVVWCAGIAPPRLVERLDVPVDERGYILCERDLRVRGHEDVWGIGDCAVNTDAENKAYPATAQHAVRQGRHLARNLAAALRGGDTEPCDIKSQGSLAALGCRTGVARVFGLKFAGFPAWILWRTVYLFKMPVFSRRVRVAIDWTLHLIFRRDYVQLGVHHPEMPE